jgi:phospholipid/cholesterol/gamma-HCH transport system substrate-binding protein
MKTTGTLIKLGCFTGAMLFVLFALLAIFANLRFDSTHTYRAEFTNVTGLRTGEFVRIAGVEVGKVDTIDLGRDRIVTVAFTVQDHVEIPSGATVAVRWANLIGDHYLEVAQGAPTATRLRPGDTIPVSQTSPGLDLDALIGGFRPLFRALEPDQVNRLSTSLIASLQGEGGTIANVLSQTAELTATLADRDQLIGSVINNLNRTLETFDRNADQFDLGLDKLQSLVSGLSAHADPIAASLASINDASATVSGLLGQIRPDLSSSITELGRVAGQINSDRDYVDNVLGNLPDAYAHLTRLGIFGDFFSFYLCDANLKVNGKDGNPVYINIIGQRAGRCVPQ